MDELPNDISYETYFNYRYYVPSHNTKIIYDTVEHRTLHLRDGLKSIKIIFSIRWLRFKTRLRLFTPFWIIFDYEWFKHQREIDRRYNTGRTLRNYIHFDFKSLFSNY